MMLKSRTSRTRPTRFSRWATRRSLARRAPLLLEPLEERLLLTVTWTGGAATTNWDTPANWSGNALPGSSDDVVIPAGITITHSAGTADSVNSITAGAGDILTISSGSITVAGAASLANLNLSSSGAFTENGAGTISGALAVTGGTFGGSGSITVESGGTMSIAGSVSLSKVTVDNQGAATWTAGTVSIGSSGTFENDGTFDDQINGTISGGGTFLNTGTFTKSAGTGTTTFSTPLNNSGTFNVNAGSVSLNDGGTDTGAFNTLTSTELEFAGGSNYTLGSGASLGGPGVYAALTNFGSLTVNTAISVNNLQLNVDHSTGLSGTGTITISQDFQWSTGTIALPVTVNQGATFEIHDTSSALTLNSTITNAGAATYSSTSTLGGSGAFNNSGAFNDQSDAQINLAFNNSGTFTKSAGTSLSIGGPFNNSGTVNVNSGTLAVRDTGTETGTFNTQAGTELEFISSVVGGTISLNAGTALNGPGLYDLNGQFVIVAVNTPLSVANLEVDTGTLSGAGGVTVTGDMKTKGGTVSGVVTIAPAATLEIVSGTTFLSGTINNAGATTYTGTLSVAGGTFNNSGTFNDQTDNTIGATGTHPTFNNSGTFLKSAGTSISLGFNAFNNSGIVDVDSGQITVGSAATESGSFNTLAGTGVTFTTGVAGGTYTFSQNVAFNGPGTYTAAGQFTTIAFNNTALAGVNLQFGAGAMSGTLNIQPSAAFTLLAGTSALAADVVLNNFGSIVMQSGSSLGLRDGILNNFGTVNLVGNASTFEGGGTINNSGLLEQTGGAATSNIVAALNNTGIVAVNTGTLNFTGAIAQIQSGTLAGGAWNSSGATLKLPASFTTNDATISLAGAGATITGLSGLLANAGNFSLLAGAGFTTVGKLANSGTITLGAASTLTVNGAFTQSSAGELDEQFAGSPDGGQFGQLHVTGAAALDGTLGLALAGSFVPANGDAYQPITFASQTGAFAAIDRQSPGAGQLLSVTTNPANVTVTRVGAGADLAVTSVTVPAAGVVGQNVTINYTVQNLDPSTTDTNAWQDSVYLSLSPTLNSASLLIGRVAQSGVLAGGASYSGTLTAAVPGVGLGQYHVIVVADSRGNITDTDRSNNTLASTSQINVDDPVLSTTTPATGTIANNQDVYYKLPVAAGSSVTLSLTTASAGGAELYVQYQSVPTQASYTQFAFQPTAGTQTITIPGTAAGTYYILIHGRQAADSGSAYSLSATVEPFAITSLGLATGGQGQVTIPITGSQFDARTTFQLLGPDSAVINAQTVYAQDDTQEYATFDLSAAALGTYTVQATKSGGITTQHAGAFTVIPTVAANLQLNLDVPSATRPNRQGSVTVTYTNTGNTDLVAPLLQLTADNAVLKLEGQSSFSTSGSVWFLGTSATGPAGIIRPGESGQATITFQTTGSLAATAVNFQVNSADTSQPMDWASQEEALRLPTISEAAWPAVYANFVANMGSTVASYNATLATDATYLAQLGQPMNDVSQLLAFEMQKASGAYTTETLDTVTADSLPAPGLALTFDQIYLQSIAGRYTQGILGNGWTTNWDISASTDASGDAVFDESGMHRFFFIQPDGSYQPEAGDHATVTLTAGAFRLTETDGTIFQFNTGGSLAYVEDTHGNRITCGYNGAGQLVSLTHSDGEFLTLTYNAQGHLAQLTDSNGLSETYGYDPTGQFLTTYTDRYGTTTYSYITGSSPQQNNALAEIAYQDNTHLYFSYDSQGRLVDQHRDNGQEDQSYSYLPGGGYTLTDGDGNTAAYLFDRAGGIAETIDPLGNVTHYQYDSNLNVTSVTGPGGSTSSFDYDANGNVVSETDPLGLTTTFTYDAHNNLTSYTDARGNTTGYTYDAQNDLLATTYADGTQQQYSYNPLGEATSYLNANGQSIHSTYNAAGLVTQETFSDGTQYSYTYDPRGNMLTATDATGTTTFSYTDPRNPDFLTKVAYPDGTFLQFTYNVVGQRTQMVDQTGFTVNYQYDALGRLQMLIDGSGNLIVQYTYDAAGRLIQKDNGNGTRTTYTYDAAGEVLSITNLAPDHATVNSYDNYTYDALGNVLSDAAQNGTWTYAYDADSQLTGAAFVSTNTAMLPNQSIQYVYDAAGNRISQTVNGVTTTYTTNSVNEYTTSTTAGVTTNYTYDADGNLISDGTSTYSYNILRQLTGISGPGGTTINTYNALGERVAQTAGGQTTHFMFDPIGLGNVVATFDGTGSLISHFTYGVGLTSLVTAAGTSAYYDFNNVGSTVGITGANGAYVNQYAYMPFGQTITVSAAVANPFTFVGQFGVQNDGGGLYNMLAREYVSTSGQFTSNDQLGIEGGQTNVRLYVGADPTGELDPSGNCPICIILGVLGVTGACSSPWWYPAVKPWLDRHWPWPNWPYDPRPTYGPPSPPDPNLVNAARAALWVLRGINLVGDPGNGAGGTGAPSGDDDPCPCGCPANDPNCPSKPGPKKPVPVAHSFDPNEITGPAGFGTQAFVAGTQALNYSIEFENESSATAPAQQVVVTEQLDASLDWSTFQLGSFGFGNIAVNVPAGHSSYQTIVDDRAATGLYVEVQAGLNLATGLVTWTFTSLDPDTLDEPADPLAGFLPPDAIPPEGIGFANYSVKAKSSDPTGTPIAAQATVVFDSNPPLNTPTVSNTIDAVAPTSAVAVLPSAQRGRSFTVNWSGQDDAGGSGVAGYNILVSVDGGPYTVWLNDTTATSATYTSLANTHTYAFKSQAIDNAGNVEAAHALPDATTTVLWLAGDVNNDNVVNGLDISLVASNWLHSGTDTPGDANGDGTVNGLDISLIASNWLHSAPGAGSGSSNAAGAHAAFAAPSAAATLVTPQDSSATSAATAAPASVDQSVAAFDRSSAVPGGATSARGAAVPAGEILLSASAPSFNIPQSIDRLASFTSAPTAAKAAEAVDSLMERQADFRGLSGDDLSGLAAAHALSLLDGTTSRASIDDLAGGQDVGDDLLAASAIGGRLARS